MNPRFKKGDLVQLNRFGKVMLYPTYKDVVSIGLVMTDAYDIFYPDSHDENYMEYWGYDVMFGDNLITMIPEEFIIKPGEKDETDIEELAVLFE